MDSTYRMLSVGWSVTELHYTRVVSLVSRWRELLEGKSLQENGEVRSRRFGEGGEYFISPCSTAVILISTSIHCDILLAKQGESDTIKNMSWTLLYKNTRPWF